MRELIFENVYGMRIFKRDEVTYERDLMYKHDIFIVSGTHPDKQNFDGTSRGRKRHLSNSREPGSMTYCSLVVTDNFTEHINMAVDNKFIDRWCDNGLCGNCKKEIGKKK